MADDRSASGGGRGARGTDVGGAVALTPETDEAFRYRVRGFLDAHAHRRDDPEVRRPAGDDAALVEWATSYQAALYDAGLAGLTWPIAYGGQGLTTAHETIFNEEAGDLDLPSGVFSIGFGMCIPTLLAHGSEELKQRYVRPAARGEEIWCQLFSEPSAGSDVASLQTRAVRDGDEWIVDGQKVWTSGAQHCDFGILLARTDPEVPKHRGLTMFVLDMHAAGVAVRPLRQMNGASNFNEVFLDSVRIPGDQVVGEPGEGWRVAITTLMNERVSIGAGRSAATTPTPVEPVEAHLDTARRRRLQGDPLAREGLADLLVQARVLDLVGLRVRAAASAGRVPGPEGSIAKLAGSLLAARAAQLGAALAGPEATLTRLHRGGSSPWAERVLSAPAASIAGGTSEVMRNILGERVLGLPKEPEVDRSVPFSQVRTSEAPDTFPR